MPALWGRRYSRRTDGEDPDLLLRQVHAGGEIQALVREARRRAERAEGLCLDIFTGSGSTGVACVLEGFHFMGFEAEERFVEIARARIAHWQARAA